MDRRNFIAAAVMVPLASCAPQPAFPVEQPAARDVTKAAAAMREADWQQFGQQDTKEHYEAMAVAVICAMNGYPFDYFEFNQPKSN